MKVINMLFCTLNVVYYVITIFHPDSLPPQTRQAAVLTPTVAAPVPRLGDASTRFSIEIEWDAAPPLDVARDSPILYQLDYSLRLSGEENAGPLTSVVVSTLTVDTKFTLILYFNSS